MTNIRQKLLATFQVEHRDHVEQIRSLLALIATAAGKPGNTEIDEAFRRAHSLKGAARAVDLGPVEGLAHRMETLFSRVRQGSLLLTSEVSVVIQQALDAMEDCVSGLGDSRPAPSVQPALRAMEAVLGIEPEKEEAAAAEHAPSEFVFQPLETVRIMARNFDGMLQSAGGLIAETQHQDQAVAEITRIVRELDELAKQTDAARRTARTAVRGPIRPGELDKLDTHLNSVELKLRALARSANAAARLHRRSSWKIGGLGKQLQQDVLRARMAPAESLFEGYRKMVRDLARDEGKDIEFRAASAGAHADRRVLDALKDPLMHVLRNAVSHGIESPRDRVAKGKSAIGSIALSIRTEGQRLRITVEDDGSGVDIARVREIAVRRKILSEDDAARCSPKELARILFRPDFSTARTITSLSGRGMGLSVVEEAVRRLQGEVDIEPGRNSGAAVHISAPVSISAHRLLLARSAGQTFGVPMHGIERLLRIRVKEIDTVAGNPGIRAQGEFLPLYALQHLLNLSGAPIGAAPDVLAVMVLRSQNGLAAVAVDSFAGEIDGIVQGLGPAMPHQGVISGGVLLEDGEIALVLNSIELLEKSSRQAPLSLFGAETKAQQLPSSILVVDDSLTTRTLEKSILEANGYRVRVAVDGAEALVRLGEERSDLVITDIQMPEMDGFDLLAAMKKDPSLSSIPVIIVTSLDRREDQERGLELGADAYIVKRKFDQQELLGAIRQIL